MRLLLADVHKINEGIYTENYDLIENGAVAINSHPPLSESSRRLVQETLADKMATFGKFDDLVHDHADSVRYAAQRQEMDRILYHYRNMQQGCVNCHNAFKDEIKRERFLRNQE